MTAPEHLADYDWITAGLAEHGYDWLAGEYARAPLAGTPFAKLRDAVRRAGAALSREPACLADQLLGRLTEADDPLLAPLLERLAAEQGRRPFQLIRSGLQRPSGSLLAVLNGHLMWVSAIAVDRTGSLAATVGWDGHAIIWEMATGARVRMLTPVDQPRTDLRAVAFAGDGTRVITGGEYGKLTVWDAATGEEVQDLSGHQNRVESLAVSRDGRVCASGDSDGVVIVWDLAAGTRLHTLVTHWDPVHGFVRPNVPPLPEWADSVVSQAPDPVSGRVTQRKRRIQADLSLILPSVPATAFSDPVYSVAVTDDGSRAVTCGPSGTAVVWDLVDGSRLHTLTCPDGRVWTTGVAGDGRYAVVGGARTVSLWNLSTGVLERILTGPASVAEPCAVSGDGTRIVIGVGSGVVSVWDVPSGQWGHTIADSVGSDVSSLAVNGDGTRAVSAGMDGMAVVWDLEAGTALHTLEGHGDWVHAVAISESGDRALTGGEDGTAVLWDLTAPPAGLLLPTGHSREVLAVTVTADGTRAISAGEDGTAIVWDLTSGSRLLTLIGHNGPVASVVTTPDGARAITSARNEPAIVWDLTSGSRLLTLTGHNGPVGSVAVSDDSRIIFTGDRRSTVKMWDAATGELLNTLTSDRTGRYPHGGLVTLMTLRHGSRLIAGADPGYLIVWDLPGGTQPYQGDGTNNGIEQMNVSRDGRRAVTSSHDLPPFLWDLETGERVRVLGEHYGRQHAVAISPDGTRAVTGGSGAVYLWDLDAQVPPQVLAGSREHGRVAPFSIGSAWRTVAFSGDGAWILGACADGTVIVWEAATGERAAAWYGDVPMSTAIWAPAEPVVVAGDESGAVHILRLRA